ncbi:B3 domain-containing protein At5g57720 [Raphanus sativus]|uniref:B3 domain-containing protein At5g57720 n=1 Tax=Raphanus sativus TaxID=3726 RepID=A0A6J0MCN4_RAPSA|nr:B3 domain-containing protein At5g57720 [Raphanus sativus]
MVFTPYPDFLIVYNSQDLSLSQRLVLPSDYRQYYPTPLPQTAVLRKPEGIFWTVKWAISPEEEISFGDGWSKFIADNGPIDRDFLIFSYDGSRSFLVSIFRNGLPVKPEAPVTIQEISDDDEEDEAADNDAGDDDDKDEDYDQNMITSLSLGSSDEEYDADTTVCEVNKAHRTLKKGSTSQRIRAQPIGDPEMYLDDPKNPCFIATSSPCRRMLVIAMQVIKDYDLKFDGIIKFIDGFGELEGKIGNWKDRVVVYPWQVIYSRNDAKPGDVIICEILREGDVVRSIKAHFVKK